jgi:hypothetical protein
VTTSRKRQDAHSPTNLVTEDYAFVGSYDASPTAYMIFEVGQFGQTTARDAPGAERARQLKKMVADSTESRNDGRCDHCGATIRYRAVMRHKPTGQVIEVGEQCLENRFSVATAEFRVMKKNAEEARAGQRIRKAVAEWVEKNPDMAWLASEESVNERVAADNWFVRDISRKFRTYGEVSERQVEAVKKSVQRDAEFAERKRQRDAERAREDAERPHAPVPTGRVEVTGVVFTVREPDPNAQFPAWKMLVQDHRGFRVWGTVPSSLFRYGVGPRRGDEVSFTATVEASRDDPEFGFYSRPTGARVTGSVEMGSGK